MPTRRRLIKGLGAIAAVSAGGLALFGGRNANAYYNGPISDHFDGRVFFNPGHAGPKSFGDFLRWNLLETSEKWPDSFPSPHLPPPPTQLGGDPVRDQIRIVFVGHASFLVQAQGLNMLIDPVWSERVSPVSFVGPKRLNPPGINFDGLPRIDVIVITHNHYDHLDVVTLQRLWARFKPRIVTPLGNDAIVRQEALAGSAEPRIDAVDWGHTTALGNGIKLHAVPSLHWSARGMRDRRHALWASFVVESPAHRLYHVGDTGFGDGAIFREARARFGAMDLALLPIGAYEPRWFMKDQHMNPADAVAALELLGAKRAIGHHWGTFKLTNEGIEQPARDLMTTLGQRSIAHERFVALRPGAVIDVA